MNRQQKETVVADFKKMLSESQAAFVVNYKGMNVALMQDLRKKLRADGGSLCVTKATLMRIATQGVKGADDFSKDLKDQVGLVFAKGDVSAVAKQLLTFSKENESLKVLSGFFESRLMSKQDLTYLATLPSREILLAQLAGTMQAPVASFTRVLHTLIARLLYVLKQIEEKQKA
jgi:large subunit ribosomal protein L10